MKAEKRQQLILNELKSANDPIIARKLAEKFEVSRQVIVGDIALLRAAGEEIISTPKGYLLHVVVSQEIKRKFVCKHRIDETADEINTIVGLGGKILDVAIEHPVYGEITGALNIFDQADADMFNQKVENKETSLLSELTEGVHIHTIAAVSLKDLDLIEEALKEKGYLYKTSFV